MPDGSIVFDTKIDNRSAEKDLKQLERKIAGLMKSASETKIKRNSAFEQMQEYGVELDAAKEKLESLRTEQSAVTAALQPGASPGSYIDAYSRNQTLGQELQAEQSAVDALQKKFDKVYDKVDQYDAKLKETETALQKNQEQAGILAKELNHSSGYSDRMVSALQKSEKAMGKFGARLSSTLKSALIFSVMYKGLSILRDYMGRVLKTNTEFMAQLARLKGALLTAFQPIVEVAIPALTYLMQILTQVANLLVRVFAFFSGKSSKQLAKNAEEMYEEANAVDAVGDAAKKSGKQLAAFDEINQISGDSGGAGSTGGASGMDADFDTQSYKNKIDELTLYLGGALLALGAILVFSGANIPLGIALMAAGAAVLVSELSENWDALPQQLKDQITQTLAIIGGALLVIGMVLAFSGAAIPQGIALMAIGAATLAAAIKINPNALVEMLKGPVGLIVGVASAALLALGLILALSGASIPLGIALIAVGAAGLAAVVSLNWEAIVTALQGPIGKIVAVVSGALLALGIILALSGVALPLGIALIAIGAAGLATVTALNWDSIVTALQGPTGKIVAMVSGILLVLGLILVLSGVGLPLGIALIAAGAAGLVTVTALNWNAVLDKMKNVWKGIKNWWKTSVAPVFTLEFWKDKFSCIAEGLVQKIKDGVNSGIALLNQFISWLNEKLHISWNAVTILGKEIIPAGSIQLFTLPSIPYLAQGAVIPPNREFLAVLGDQQSGTNIEAPLETIKQAVAEVLAQRGTGANGDITVILELNNREFGRAVVQAYKEESRRVGVSLAY